MFLKKLGLASRTCALQNSLPVLARSLLHNSRNRQIKKAHANMVAGTLGSDVWREEEGAAAGICFYCYNKEKEDLCVLLLKESRRNREAAWTWPGGKRRRDQTLLGRPARETLRATAARETEEETHWQLTAERVGPLLDACQHIVCLSCGVRCARAVRESHAQLDRTWDP
uniref:Nudix hydrolase domain-containing protein n=1 Tax=Dunaliella tertiolecta TaxID=3047 RepID=A0A7S3QMT6_DUNTE